jgi:hypothetical protein
MNWLAPLRDAAWFDGVRARTYAWPIAAALAIGLIVGWASMVAGHRIGFAAPPGPHKPYASDFTAFWVAGRMALTGHVASVYDLNALGRAENAAVVLAPGELLAFFYPPTFLLLCLPFAALPYLAGFAAFVAAQTIALVVALRRIVPRAWGYLPILAFPGLLMNAGTGQNGFISASCFAGAVIWLDRRPALAGACLGGLVMKPHFALIVPIALLAARRWTALCATAATAVAIMALSWLVLGATSWQGFWHSLPYVRAALEAHQEDWGKLQSVFTAVRLAGAPLGAAYAAQTLLALALSAGVAAMCWRRPGGSAEMALTAAAALLCTPHVLDYDLAVCAVPLAWVAACAARDGWLPWEKLAASAAFCWPVFARITTRDGLPLAPIVLLALFAITWRRAALGGAAADPAARHVASSHGLPA